MVHVWIFRYQSVYYSGFSFTLIVCPKYGHMLCAITVFVKSTLIVVISQNCCKSIKALRCSTARITGQFFDLIE